MERAQHRYSRELKQRLVEKIEREHLSLREAARDAQTTVTVMRFPANCGLGRAPSPRIMPAKHCGHASEISPCENDPSRLSFANFAAHSIRSPSDRPICSRRGAVLGTPRIR